MIPRPPYCHVRPRRIRYTGYYIQMFNGLFVYMIQRSSVPLGTHRILANVWELWSFSTTFSTMFSPVYRFPISFLLSFIDLNWPFTLLLLSVHGYVPCTLHVGLIYKTCTHWDYCLQSESQSCSSPNIVPPFSSTLLSHSSFLISFIFHRNSTRGLVAILLGRPPTSTSPSYPFKHNICPSIHRPLGVLRGNQGFQIAIH